MFDFRIFGYARLRKIINTKKIVRFCDAESVIRDFQALSSESQRSVGILFSFYVVLGLHDAFRNITPLISEKGLFHIDMATFFFFF